MKILHPNHTKYLSLEELKAYYIDGYYKIIGLEEEEKLTNFLKCFEDFRTKNNEKITDISLYQNLPFSIQDNSWKAKQKDIKVIDKLIGNKTNLKILDVGCWNGWLCNYLSKKGHQAVGVDIFIDEFDGLKAFKHYQSKYTSIQMNINEVYRIKDKFDLIVFNRVWAYFNDHQKIFNDAKQLLTNKGIIIFTGLTFYKNPKRVINNLQKSINEFKNQYGISLLYNPNKGYLDSNDKMFFSNNDISLKSCNKIKNDLFFLNKKGKSFYAVYFKN